MKEPEGVPILQEENEELKECTKNKKLPDDKLPKKVSWKQKCSDLIADLEDNNLTEASSDLSKNIEDIKKTIKLTIQEIDEIKKEEHECDPIKEEASKESYILQLYKQISKLSFDLDSSEDEIQGFVASNQLSTFHLNTKEHTQYYIANHLWNLIGDDGEST
ncbi:uncharacterized protein LOC129217373 [Uloborus diversus]|uniref:uncharacterized protein LOC129217373 n=1 Tax=Uloborus diversus TaxID=327109 RepID=UPI00240A6238|nr:uncharacterized protein LOC129217373 [Uloborus diversus]